ncbi:MAG: bifunctional folylpolyglutamate synthase/dihydrofolate synthase [Chitinophagaceae bacterium]|jgi:dihydrofolate synthase/folylpolyglutamate synthase|nr:bifunctional folylpolyglutamate synthase/dihydrofolate synthase [Chitinophagaceae bacterium]
MNYQETLDYLFAKLPMFSRIGAAAYKADLTNTIALCNAIQNPQQHFKTIHIAGTNGKGSTSHMLAAILQTAGYKTGLYTSPHLKDFRERIKINGELCSEQFVIDFTQKIQSQIEAIEPSFFEITVAMAFEYFALHKVDIAIIETGLGGRLDSTNIIHPELSIITNIGFDHMNLLGNTLDKIAYEKAGIINPKTPVVIGEYNAITQPVFEEKAKSVLAPITYAQERFQVKSFESATAILNVEVEEVQTKISNHYQLDLAGIYQTKNLVTILEAVRLLNLQGWNIREEHLQTALRQVKQLTGLHGRWELLQTNPTIIADVAHNVDGIKQILEQLKHCSYQTLHIVVGMVKDKDIEAAIALLPKEANYYFTQAQIERALPANELQALAAKHQLAGNHFKNVNMAIEAAKNTATYKDLILVCGSVFLVGEIGN